MVRRFTILISGLLIIGFAFLLIKNSKRYKLKQFENLVGFSLPENSKVNEFYEQSFSESSHKAYWVLIEGDITDCGIIAQKLRLDIFPNEWGYLHLSPPREVAPWWSMLSSRVRNEKIVYHGNNRGKWSRVVIQYKDGCSWCYFDGEYKL